MIRQLPNTWWLIVGITLVSVILVQLGGKAMLDTAKANRVGLALGYLIGGVLFGLLAVQIYLWMSGWWPETASRVYFWTAIGLTVLLTAGAVGMYWVVKDVRVCAIWVALNLIGGLGYGWYLPSLIRI